MFRSTLLVFAALAAGCGDKTYQERAEAAHDDAREKTAKAADRAGDDAAEAHADEQRKLADATADFETDRENYRHEAETNLVKVDKQIADLEAKKTTAPEERASLDAKLTQLRAAREVYSNDVKSLDTVGSDAWTETKGRLDREWESLDKLGRGV